MHVAVFEPHEYNTVLIGFDAQEVDMWNWAC
jgi:hypothetical protein